MENEITVVILAGGRGRRMDAQDKGLVVLYGQPLIEYVIKAISPQNSNILINANQNIEQYQHYGYPVVSDQITGFQGPLAGVATAMERVKTPYILTLPCDAPFVERGQHFKLSKPIWQSPLTGGVCNLYMPSFRCDSTQIYSNFLLVKRAALIVGIHIMRWAWWIFHSRSGCSVI